MNDPKDANNGDGIPVRVAAQLLTCHRQNIHNLIRVGKLKVVGFVRGRGPGGRNLLVSSAAVRRLQAHGYGLDVPSQGRRGKARRPT